MAPGVTIDKDIIRVLRKLKLNLSFDYHTKKLSVKLVQPSNDLRYPDDVVLENSIDLKHYHSSTSRR